MEVAYEISIASLAWLVLVCLHATKEQVVSINTFLRGKYFYF